MITYPSEIGSSLSEYLCQKSRQEGTVLLGPVVGPSRTGEPEHGRGWPVGASVERGRARFSTRLSSSDRQVLPCRRDVLCPSLFHADGVTPPLASHRRKAFTNAKTFKEARGGNSVCKKRGPGSARAARGGVLSRPDERSRLKKADEATAGRSRGSRSRGRLFRSSFGGRVRRGRKVRRAKRAESFRNARPTACRRHRREHRRHG